MKLSEKFKTKLTDLLISEGLMPNLTKYGHILITYDISVENGKVVNLKRLIPRITLDLN